MTNTSNSPLGDPLYVGAIREALSEPLKSDATDAEIQTAAAEVNRTSGAWGTAPMVAHYMVMHQGRA